MPCTRQSKSSTKYPARSLGTRFETIPDVHYGKGAHFVAGDRGDSFWKIVEP